MRLEAGIHNVRMILRADRALAARACTNGIPSHSGCTPRGTTSDALRTKCERRATAVAGKRGRALLVSPTANRKTQAGRKFSRHSRKPFYSLNVMGAARWTLSVDCLVCVPAMIVAEIYDGMRRLSLLEFSFRRPSHHPLSSYRRVLAPSLLRE